MAGSIFSKGRRKNETELDAAIKGSLQTSLCAMSAEVQADFKKWQMETHPNARYSTPSMRHKFVPAPYDLTVMRFPVDGWQSNPSRTRRGSSDQALRMTKYRYYGFRMVLGTEALDVGPVIKASTYKCQDDAHSPRSTGDRHANGCATELLWSGATCAIAALDLTARWINSCRAIK